MTTPSLRDAMADAVAEAMMEHGPDGHCDGHEEIADAALKVVGEWLRSKEANSIVVRASNRNDGRLLEHALADALTKEGE